MKECSLSLSLSFLLLSLHHLYSLTLRQIWERTLAHTRIHSHTNTNKLSQANFKARLNLFSSRQDDSRGHFSPSRSSSVRSKSYLFMFSLARLLVLIFGVLWQPLHVWFYRDNQSWSKTPLFPIQGNFLKFVLCVIWPWLKVMNKPGRQNKMNKALSVLYWVLIM